MTMPDDLSHTTQLNRKFVHGGGKCITDQEGGGFRKMKPHHLHCHPQLLLQETVYSFKFHTL